MLLILQGIHDRPVTENTMLLERLVAKVISPYLGMLGLYDGGTEPEVRSNYKIPSRLPSPVICKCFFLQLLQLIYNENDYDNGCYDLCSYHQWWVTSIYRL